MLKILSTVLCFCVYFYSETCYMDDFYINFFFTIDLVKCIQKFAFQDIQVAFQQIQ